MSHLSEIKKALATKSIYVSFTNKLHPVSECHIDAIELHILDATKAVSSDIYFFFNNADCKPYQLLYVQMLKEELFLKQLGIHHANT